MIGQLLDRAIGVFSPLAEARRVQARAALGAYRAAERTRRNKDWKTKSRSADASVIPDQPLMIQRCRDAVRNDPYIASINESFVRNVVGKGFTHQSAATDRAGQPLEEFNRAAGDAFWQWSNDARRCDAEQRHTLRSFQRWCMSELVQAGGCLVILSWSADMDLMLQAVEYEQLNRTLIQHDNNEVRGGIEVDRFGAAVAFHIYERHPFDYAGIQRSSPLSLQSTRIPADRVLHIYEPKRARQSLGAPIIASVLDKARSLDQYDTAQLDAARAEACIGFMITSTQPSNVLGFATPVDNDASDADGNAYFDQQPLMVGQLQPGEDVKGFTPTRPGNMYEPFVRAHLRAMAAGCGISYDQIARDPDGHFSAARQNLLEDRRNFAAIQQLIIEKLLNPVYAEWVRLEILSGRISVKGLNATPRTISYCDWLPHGHEWIDPEKEAKAEALAIETGQKTRTESLASRGRDYREVTRQSIAEEVFERDARAAAGLAPVVEPAQPTGVTA